jgi:hypothetical protein
MNPTHLKNWFTNWLLLYFITAGTAIY